MENLDEQQIIPELYDENEEDIKSLEKSMEKSIDKSFDKSYEKSINMSVNQSYNQSINQSYNQSITQSYIDNSFVRNSSKLGSTGGGLIQKLNKVFNESISEDKNEFEENEKDESKENNEGSKKANIYSNNITSTYIKKRNISTTNYISSNGFNGKSRKS